MLQIKDICRHLEQWAPPALAESYDNVGLLVGDPNTEVTNVLVSLDCTEAIVDEAIRKNCNLIVSHHPIVFKGLKKITGRSYVERTLLKAIKNDIALYAIHTNLDAVMNGVNAKIAERIGLENVEILSKKREVLHKLVVYVPNKDVEAVRTAMFKAGAGDIGNYSHCSFNLVGEGTFLPGENTNPAVGSVGSLHAEAETQVEVILPSYNTRQVITAMIKAHPYEEVAYDVYALLNEHPTAGSGMIGSLQNPLTKAEFLEHLKKTMKASVIRYTESASKTVRKVAICGGSGSFLLHQAKQQGADVFVTGDFKYHEFFDGEGSIMIADIGHYESEQFTIDLIGDYLRKKFTTFAIRLTEENTNPIHYF
jgi:dinuclear metal center YbgI/SA1388 family protein